MLFIPTEWPWVGVGMAAAPTHVHWRQASSRSWDCLALWGFTIPIPGLRCKNIKESKENKGAAFARAPSGLCSLLSSEGWQENQITKLTQTFSNPRIVCPRERDPTPNTIADVVSTSVNILVHTHMRILEKTLVNILESTIWKIPMVILVKLSRISTDVTTLANTLANKMIALVATPAWEYQILAPCEA